MILVSSPMDCAYTMISECILKSGTKISKNLEFHAVRALSRFIVEPIDLDSFTFRFVKKIEENAKREEILVLGDECLIGCSLFPKRIEAKIGIERVTDVGRSAYQASGHLEASYGFSILVDVLAAVSPEVEMNTLVSLARSGSKSAAETLAKSNVVTFRRNPRLL